MLTKASAAIEQKLVNSILSQQLTRPEGIDIVLRSELIHDQRHERRITFYRITYSIARPSNGCSTWAFMVICQTSKVNNRR